MHTIVQIDKILFRWINSGLQNVLFDSIFPILRISLLWIPLYLFLLIFVFSNYRKNAWWWILFAVFTGVLSDYVSSDIVKEMFFRLRPCHEPGLGRLLVSYCPQSSSFTSSHATNHFAFACFLVLTLHDIPARYKRILLGWAASIAFAQVYVGVHYPLDVICGGLLGLMLGFLVAKAFNAIFGLESFAWK
jgi:undecaprenyl-diphosphatase